MEGKSLRVLERFAVDMKKMFSRARRMLRSGGILVVAIGDSTVGGIHVDNTAILVDAAARRGSNRDEPLHANDSRRPAVHATTTQFGRKCYVETAERRNCRYFLRECGFRCSRLTLPMTLTSGQGQTLLTSVTVLWGNVRVPHPAESAQVESCGQHSPLGRHVDEAAQ